jgi:actin-like ATPase involved in cell morphogenesis
MSDIPWVLAIDFGSSYTVAASRVGERSAEIIEIDGERRLPSLIVVDEHRGVMVGKAAESLAATSPGRVLRHPKSRLGEPGPVVLGGRSYAPTALVGELLRHVLGEAMRYHDGVPHQVRLTYPATWSQPRRQQLVEAARHAGVPDPVLVSEPVAAAVSYADSVGLPPGGNVLVYDLGGGTFDTAALRASADGFAVVGRPAGDARLGGELFDELLADAVGQRLGTDVYERMHAAADALWHQAALGVLRESRRVKEALSSHPFADMLLGLPSGLVQHRVTQQELFDVIRPHIDESVDLMRHTAAGAGLEADDLSSIYLVGGASRTPLVEQAVRGAFPTVHISRRGDPKGVVALGATHELASAHSAPVREASGLTPVVAPPAANIQLPPPPHAQGPAARHQSARRSTRRPWWVAAVVAALVAVVTGGAVLLTKLGNDDISTATAETDDRERDRRPTESDPSGSQVQVNPRGVPIPAPSATSETSAGAPADTTTGPSVSPPPTATSTTTAPTVVAAPSAPTAAQMTAALATIDDFGAGMWEEVPVTPTEPVCGRTSEVGKLARVDRAFQSTSVFPLFVEHSVVAFDSVDAAAVELQASLALLTGCTGTSTTADGVTYEVQVAAQPQLPVDVVATLPCHDEGALVTYTYLNPDALLELIVVVYTVLRCGSNVLIFGVGSDDDNLPGDVGIALTNAILRFDKLPGS